MFPERGNDGTYIGRNDPPGGPGIMRGGGKGRHRTKRRVGSAVRPDVPHIARCKSSPAHQRESANMIHAMKKRGISDKGRAVATG